MSKPDWKIAPEGMNWLAQDRNGEWFWWLHEPYADLEWGEWTGDISKNDDALAAEADGEEVIENWTETLEHRPLSEARKIAGSASLRRAGAIYNELSTEHRSLLHACLMEHELRLIKREQDLIMERAKKAVAEHQVRFNNIKRDLDKALRDIAGEQR